MSLLLRTLKFEKASRRPSWTSITLLVIISLSLFLRLYQLGAESIWLDEAISVSIASNNIGQVLELSFPDGNPPLYYLLLHYWMWLFGDSEVSVRLPSVVFGLGSVAMMYKVGSILFSKVTGLISASILALSVYHIFFSQEARTYSMMVLLTLVSFYFFLRLFEGKNYKVLAGYVLSTAALMYSHYYGLFFVVAQALFLLGFYSPKRHREHALSLKTWALTGGTIAILYIPGFLYLVYALTHPEHRGWIEETVFGQLNLVSLLHTYAVYAQAPGLRAPKYYFALLMLFALISVVALAANTGERAKLYLLSLWLLLPLVLPLLLSQIATPLVHARYSIAALPAFYLLAAEGIKRVTSLARRTPANRPVSLTVLCIIGVVLLVTAISSLDVLHRYFTTEKKEPWRTVVSDMETQAKRGDLLIISPELSRFPFDYYASRETLSEELQVVSLDDHEQANEVGSVASGSDRVWLLLQIDDDNKRERFKAELEKGTFEEIDHKLYPVTHQRDVDLTLFEK